MKIMAMTYKAPPQSTARMKSALRSVGLIISSDVSATWRFDRF